MKIIFFILNLLTGICAFAQSNQHVLTSAGGSQGPIGNYYFEFSVGQPFTETGQGGSFWNTPGILQPISISGPLPVTLVRFDVRKSEPHGVLLTWVTSDELNSDHFEVQRSRNGKSWGSIGEVDAGGETNHTIAHYAFTDEKPAQGENFYRIKMIDRDATFAYSQIRSIKMKNTITTSAYPNPVSDHLNVHTARWDDVHSVSLSDITGREVYRSPEIPVSQIQVSKLPAGLYVLSLLRKSGELTTCKVVVKR